MTDRHSGYIVVLEKEIREDDAQETINAIKQIKGVLTVQPIVNDITLQIAKATAKSELAQKLWETLRESDMK